MGEHTGGGSSGDIGASREIEDTANDIPALDGLSGAGGLVRTLKLLKSVMT